jgi:hypothetical protein
VFQFCLVVVQLFSRAWENGIFVPPDAVMEAMLMIYIAQTLYKD